MSEVDDVQPTPGLQRFTHTSAGRPIVKSERLGPPDKAPCDECGLPHVGCVAHQSDRVPLHPCGNLPIRGGERCASHGAAKGSVLWKQAQRRKANAEVVRLMEHLDIEPVDNAADALSLAAGEVVAFKNLMAGKLADLAADDWRWASAEGAEQLHAYVALWERALDRVERFLVPMAKLDLDERRVRVTEAQASLAMEAIVHGLKDHGFDEERIEAIKTSIVRYLTGA